MSSLLDNVSKKILGKIGEDIPESEFTNIQNLNERIHNFPVFDIIAYKDGEVYVFSAKARKLYSANGKINSRYNILYGKTVISRKYKKALDEFKKMGLDINKIHYCFLLCPIEENKPCVYYWGEFTEINPLCITSNIINSGINYFGIPVSENYLMKYKIFGKHSWEYIMEKYLLTE